MTKWMQLPLALALVGTLACDRGDRSTADGGAVGTSGSEARDIDRGFVQDQLAAGHAEIELGRLAQQKAGSPDVREFGAMMVRDHQKAGDELKQIAGRHDIQPEARDTAGTSGAAREPGYAADRPSADRPEPTGSSDMMMDDEHRELHQRLSRLSGAEFDREYIDAMVNDHEKAVDAVEDKANDGDNSDVKQWAATTLPALKQHLERARQIQSSLRDHRSGR
jgi:putative membrane protein